MKKHFIALIVCFISLAVFGQNYFQLSFRKLNGDTVTLNSYSGKKTMYIILPLSQSDPVYSQLQAFKNRYHDSVRIVGILSIEDGFQPASSASIGAMYYNMGIIITEAMNTKKGAGQSAIMKWLTDRTQNLHFDMDAGGVGHKFFVNESGRLFAVMPAQTPLESPIINKIVHSSAQ